VFVDDLGKPIGLGRTAEVYAWKTGYVLKLFHQDIPLHIIEHEARMARIVHQAGLPSPAVQDIVPHAGRYGLVYERVLSVSMLQTLASQPWMLLRFARLLAELQVRLHRIAAVPGLPVQHDRVRNKILAAAILSPELQQTALNLLATLPLGHYVCHGDFHPGNVLLTDKGPMIIDWIDATCGHPLADVARSSLLLQMAALPQKSPGRWVPQLGRQWFHRLYLRRYLQLCPGDQRELARWRLIYAAARLSENVPERPVLLAFVQAGFAGPV
jgi:uncharacterized protein (TIGR02172 family)